MVRLKLQREGYKERNQSAQECRLSVMQVLINAMVQFKKINAMVSDGWIVGISSSVSPNTLIYIIHSDTSSIYEL